MLKPETWNCSYAAPPDDIHWENLTNSRVMWYLKSGFIHGLLLILVIFLTTPKHAAEHFDDFLHLTLGKNVRKSIMPCPFTSLWPGTKTWTSPKHFGTCKRTRHQFLIVQLALWPEYPNFSQHCNFNLLENIGNSDHSD